MPPKPPHRLSAQELAVLIAPRTQGYLVNKKIDRTSRRRSGWEKILLLAEIAVIVILLLVSGLSARGWLALRQRLPMDGVTIIDAPAIAGTHANGEQPRLNTLPPITWRDSPFFTKNPAESEAAPQSQPLDTPEHLKRWLQPVSPAQAIEIPKPVAKAATRIVIPSIGVDAPVGEGTDWESLKYKVGHHPGTANPGQRGNMVLAAHDDVYGEIFRYLPDVPVGEIITIYAGEEAFRYKITERRIITPDQAEVMLPTTGPTTTLISCYPYLIDIYRIILFGELIG
jgi:sortase A